MTPDVECLDKNPRRIPGPFGSGFGSAPRDQYFADDSGIDPGKSLADPGTERLSWLTDIASSSPPLLPQTVCMHTPIIKKTPL